MPDKNELRKHFAECRKELPPEYKRSSDAMIRKRIAELPEYGQCRALALFAADPTEPDLLPLAWESGKILLFPRYRKADRVYGFAVVRDAQDLVPGRYHIPEPRPECPAAETGLVRRETLHLVPGVAFDIYGTRLGRGGGFYDRLLADVTGPVCGVGYCCQFTELLPKEEHDRQMNIVITEEYTIQWDPIAINKEREQ